MLDDWFDRLRCPLDQSPLHHIEDAVVCPVCGFRPATTVIDNQAIPDFRAQHTPRRITQSFTLPVTPLDRSQLLKTHFQAPQQHFKHYSRREIRAQFGTKLDKGMQYYCQQLLKEWGPDAPILDLGCGSGGNRRYLKALGFTRVLTVDWHARGADMLVDAHALPFDSAMFQMVLSTAVFEHLYNPFIAMAEVGRVLKPEGYFLGSASFWEAWHGSSYFHLTPDGWHAILQHAGLTLEDLWPGWGLIPAAFSHVLTPGRLRSTGYVLQRLVDGMYRLMAGEVGVRKLHLRASGSYQVCARKRSQG